MAVSQRHPLYCRMLPAWRICRDAYDGELCVKSKRECYLPPTPGMKKAMLDANKAYVYENYLMRAEFPHKMSNMVRVGLGILWGKAASIKLTPRLQYLTKRATYDRQTLQDFMVEITEQQFVTGRCGFMFDMPKPRVVNGVEQGIAGVPTPYLCLYHAERIINWDEGPRTADGYRALNLVVLDESEDERQPGLTYTCVPKYRVLSLGPIDTPAGQDPSVGDYRYGQFADEEPNEEKMRTALLMGKPIPFIPFYFVNAENTKVCPQQPPYLELALKSFSLYRQSADYEQQLHDQSQETPVIEGGDDTKEYALGVGSVLTPPAGSKAYFMGLTGSGLAEMRVAYVNKMTDADRLGGQMIDTRSLQRESGESLKTRLASQTATLSSIAETCGEAVEKALKDLALLLGDNPDEVEVKPNTNFVNPELFAKTLVELMQAKNMGFPLPDQELYRMAQERGVSQPDFEEAMRLLKAEPPPIMATGTPTANPAGKTPKQLTPPAPAGGAIKSAANPAGVSARGKTRTASKKNKKTE